MPNRSGRTRARGRLSAISHVEFEAAHGTENLIDWFYGEVVGLPAVVSDRDRAHVKCFRSNRLELRITITESPALERTACRAVFEVPSLEAAVECLKERRYPFVECRGLRFTDRSLMLFEPGGNRVVIRRLWPETAY